MEHEECTSIRSCGRRYGELHTDRRTPCSVRVPRYGQAQEYGVRRYVSSSIYKFLRITCQPQKLPPLPYCMRAPPPSTLSLTPPLYLTYHLLVVFLVPLLPFLPFLFPFFLSPYFLLSFFSFFPSNPPPSQVINKPGFLFSPRSPPPPFTPLPPHHIRRLFDAA